MVKECGLNLELGEAFKRVQDYCQKAGLVG